MRTGGFVRSLKYDAVPRTIDLIELFKREAYTSFDTMQGTKSHYVNCTQRVAMVQGSWAMTTRRPCRQRPNDS
nr:MAG TPA: hypothetical protein [Caudoviricetes sp.]